MGVPDGAALPALRSPARVSTTPVPGTATLDPAGLGRPPGAPTLTTHSHRCADTQDLAMFLEMIQAQDSVRVKGQADTVGTPACGREPPGPWSMTSRPPILALVSASLEGNV